MYTSVAGGGEGQDPTPECGRLHRHHFLPSKFIDLLELEAHPSGEPEGNLVKIFGSPCYYGLH